MDHTDRGPSTDRTWYDAERVAQVAAHEAERARHDERIAVEVAVGEAQRLAEYEAGAQRLRDLVARFGG